MCLALHCAAAQALRCLRRQRPSTFTYGRGHSALSLAPKLQAAHALLSPPQADPAVTLPGADKTARDLAEMYGHSAVLEVLDEYSDQVCS